MTCETYEEQISALIDHELKDEETEVLFAHLSTCRRCRHSLQSVLDLRSDFGEQVPPMAPKELDEKVLQSETRPKLYAGDRKPMTLQVWKRRISIPMPVAAAMAIVLVAGTIVLTSLWTSPQTIYVTTLPTVEVRGNFP
ncbi:MAG: zf-HC2 domain-containing protein [Ignavibacteriales bacterium]|nr:zf-HC2 domain-containing protein [Ignavibacteriales bacterium]